MAVELHRLLVEFVEGVFEDEVLDRGPEAGAVCRRDGYAVLRWIQGAGDPSVLGRDGELHGGGYVRRGGDGQRHARSRSETGSPAGRPILQDNISTAGLRPHPDRGALLPEPSPRAVGSRNPRLWL